MLIKRKRGWEIPESQVPPENIFLNRRRFLAGAGAGLAAVAAPEPAAAFIFNRDGEAETEAELHPTSDLYPVQRNLRYRVSRELTDETVASSYNNFYEFGSHKRIWRGAQRLQTHPWAVTIDGLVEEEMTLDFEDIARRMTLEERVYRFRCVEAWAMTVPWTGFPLSKLVEMARPLGSARYVRFETFMNPDMASGQRQTWYPWPYVEGLTMAEAANELSFMVTGIYGKPVAKQFGAPIRLHVPWTYGFKSIKSVVRISFTEERPVSFWEEIQGSEYGFWANVNPDVPHPRWSQATEELIGTGGERVPTQLYNGYGEFVAHLYDDLQNEPLFM